MGSIARFAHPARVLARGILCAWLAAFALRARGAERWITAKTPHFEMLSDDTSAESRRILLGLEEFRANFLRLMPLVDASEPRATVIVFDRESDFRPFKPTYNGKPRDVAGYFLPNEDEVEIAMTTDVGGPQMDSRTVIYHEYVHLLLNARKANFPPWLDEGLAEVFSTFKVEDGKVTYGDAKPEHVAYLRQSRLWPLPRLFAVTHESPDYNEDSRTGIFYAESWALTHYLLFGADKTNAGKLGKFAHLLSHGADIEASFHEVFGMDDKTLLANLEDYLDHGAYFTRSGKAIAQDQAVAFRPATDGERDLALANLKWRLNRAPSAEVVANVLVKNDPHQARPHELLAAIAASAGDLDAAQAHWRKAADLGSDNPWVYLQLLKEALSPYQGTSLLDTRLPPEQIAPLRAWANRALDLSPDNHDAIELTLKVEAVAAKMSNRAVNRGQSKVNNMRDPGGAMLALGIVHWRVNDFDSARLLARLSQADPRTDMMTRAASAELLYRLPAAATAGEPGADAIDEQTARVALNTGAPHSAALYLDDLLAKQGTTAPRLKLDPVIIRPSDSAQPDSWQRSDALRTKALDGDADAMFAMAMAHASGDGVDFSPELARDWLQKAAQHGQIMAQTLLPPGQADPAALVRSLRSEKSPAESAGFPPLAEELAAKIANAAAATDHHAPVVIYRPAQHFPHFLGISNGKGEATVQFTILANGRVDELTAKEFSDPDFATDAENFVRDWLFLPTIRDGAPADTVAEVSISLLTGGAHGPHAL
ncbi:MAG TPA: DUF1570 domain-containing protein [Opitutaceae bacterium]